MPMSHSFCKWVLWGSRGLFGAENPITGVSFTIGIISAARSKTILLKSWNGKNAASEPRPFSLPKLVGDITIRSAPPFSWSFADKPMPQFGMNKGLPLDISA